jgi:hypothetical protein
MFLYVYDTRFALCSSFVTSAYLTLSTICFAVLGYEKMWQAVGYSSEVKHLTIINPLSDGLAVL